MNLLSSEDIQWLSEEYGLIKPVKDPTDDERIRNWDVRYPLEYSGDNYDGDEEEVVIPPGKYKILRTKEAVRTYPIGKHTNLRIIGFVHLPHSFLRVGLSPGFQGIIDTNWNSKIGLRIVLQNNNIDEEIIIREGERIAYVFFCYIQTNKKLSHEKEHSGIKKPDVDRGEGIPPLKSQIEDNKEDINTIEENIQDIKLDIKRLEDGS